MNFFTSTTLRKQHLVTDITSDMHFCQLCRENERRFPNILLY